MFQENVVEEINIHFVISNVLFENSAVYKIARGRSQMGKWDMRIVFCITKSTNTLSEYVMLTAFPLQRLLQEHVSMLHYTHTASFVNLYPTNVENWASS
jgi:hypothetical protein